MNKNEEKKHIEIAKNKSEVVVGSVKQEQVHDLLMSRELDWHDIIYDLINTEQLDPWDINITVLCDKYLEKVQELEEMDFFISSKVLLAAALLLRIKSEILLNKYIKSIDDILFGKKEEKKYHLERIELDEEIPELVPKSPLPRFKKVTLQELMESLNKAIKTENRRIERVIIDRNALRESAIALPKRRISIKDKIREIYEKIFRHLNPEKNEKIKVSFSELIGEDREERIIAFLPLLHLEMQRKIWIEQEAHFEEIHIWLKKVYDRHNPNYFEELKKELEVEIMQAKEFDKEQRRRKRELKKKFHNPLREMFGEII